MFTFHPICVCIYILNLFIWLQCRIFNLQFGNISCGTWNLSLQHVGSSSLTRDQPGPPALGAWSLGPWTTTEVPLTFHLIKGSCLLNPVRFCPISCPSHTHELLRKSQTSFPYSASLASALTKGYQQSLWLTIDTSASWTALPY